MGLNTIPLGFEYILNLFSDSLAAIFSADFGWQRFYVKVDFKLHARLIMASILVEIRGKCNAVR
ncbi:MAG: hypothetical protein EBZ58_13390 [Bacteroidetes bacterium]|nr:hypothetical protein [Bacteroidota bacterium]